MCMCQIGKDKVDIFNEESPIKLLTPITQGAQGTDEPKSHYKKLKDSN